MDDDPEEIFEILDLLGKSTGFVMRKLISFCTDHQSTGQGSYGMVYKALHKKTGELVAVKMVPNEGE